MLHPSLLDRGPRRRTDALVDRDVTSGSPVPEGVLMDTPSNRVGHHAHRLELDEPEWDDLEPALARWLEYHGDHGIGRALLLLEGEGLDLEAPHLPGDFEARLLTCMRFEPSAQPAPASELALRALGAAEVEDDWATLHALVNPGLGAYGARAAAVMRHRVEAGVATQWGAFVNEQLVCVGATVRCDGETRFQEVMTHPDHRRRGYASALVSHAAHLAAEAGPVWIVADRGSSAEALYERLGFVKETTSIELGAPPPRTESQLRTLVAELEAATLPMERWRHRDHLAAATLMLRETQLSVEPALERMRTTLRRYLAAHGVESNEGAGYHETLTRGWLECVAEELDSRRTQSLACAALGVELAFADQRALLRHWSEERLMSPAARAAWVAPDREPLPSRG